MNADDPKNEENKELNKCCKEPIFSLYDEFIDSQSFQSCDTKNVARFQDFPDRIDINQNQKKKAEIERLQKLIKQGLGKNLYSENPNNITTNEEQGRQTSFRTQIGG